MKGVMKEDKLWLTGAFICQVHFCNHFTRVFLHQKNQPENQRQGIWKSPWNQPVTSCFGGIFQSAVNHNWFCVIPVPKKHMIQTWGGWWILVGVPSFVFLQESCSNNCIERCYMHLLLAQVATKLWFSRSWFGTCFAPALGDVSNHPIEFGKISTGLKLKLPTRMCPISLFARCFCILARNHTFRWRGRMVFRNGGGWSETDGVRGWEVESLTFTMQKI